MRLARLGGFGRLGPRVARFLPDERLQRIFSFQALYAGVPPDRALGAYGVIAYMDTVAGVYFPRGGMRRIGQAMADAAVAAGAEIHYGRTVTGLERSGGRVTAVRHRATERPRPGRTDRLPCDAVVLTPELAAAYRLIGRTPAPSGAAAVRPERGGAARRPAPDPARGGAPHDQLRRGLAAHLPARSSTTGRPMSDPSLLITRPTATDPGLAPPGADLLFVLAPCPNTERGALDWAELGPRYRDELLAVLAAGHSRAHRPGRRHRGQPAGHPGGLGRRRPGRRAPRSRSRTRSAQTGPFRPRNLVRGLDNVVLAGCGTTPGVGIPPVLISGRLAAQRITGEAGGERGGCPAPVPTGPWEHGSRHEASINGRPRPRRRARPRARPSARITRPRPSAPVARARGRRAARPWGPGWARPRAARCCSG